MTKKLTTSSGYMVGKPSKPPRMMPEMSVSEKDLPEIKDWKVGGKYTLEVEVEMVSSSKGSEYGMIGEGKPEHRARFKVLDIEVQGADSESEE